MSFPEFPLSSYNNSDIEKRPTYKTVERIDSYQIKRQNKAYKELISLYVKNEFKRKMKVQ